MNKAKSISKVLSKIAEIVEPIIAIATLVAIIILAVLTVVNAVNPNAVIGSDFNFIDVGPITIEIGEEYIPDNGTILVYAWIEIALTAVITAAVCYSLRAIRRVLKPISEGNPFSEAISGDIRKLGFASLVIGAVYNVIGLIETVNVIKNYHLDSIVDGGYVRAITSNYEFDFTFVIVFLVLLMVSYIFSYGRELQDLSDETL